MAIEDGDIRRAQRADWRTRKPINASEYETLIKSTHTLYERVGQTVPGWDSATGWSTTSVTYTDSTTTSEDYDLDEWLGVGLSTRKLDDGSEVVLIRFAAYLTDASARLTVEEFDETAVTTIVCTNATTTPTLVENEDTIAWSTYNGDLLRYTIEIKHEGTGATGTLTRWHVDEFTDDASLIPL